MHWFVLICISTATQIISRVVNTSATVPQPHRIEQTTLSIEHQQSQQHWKEQTTQNKQHSQQQKG